MRLNDKTSFSLPGLEVLASDLAPASLGYVFQVKKNQDWRLLVEDDETGRGVIYRRCWGSVIETANKRVKTILERSSIERLQSMEQIETRTVSLPDRKCTPKRRCTGERRGGA